MKNKTEQLVQFLLSEKTYSNRVLVLCEGELSGSLADLNIQEKTIRRYSRSLKTAKQHDAHFYGKCMPNWWQAEGKKLPEFINAGSRSQVLATFFKIIDLSKRNPQDYHLNPKKLFALVDLDIQSQPLSVDSNSQPYNLFQETEDIFKALYEQGNFKGLATYSNHIFVTGLIHKEAYFLLPELQELIAENAALYKDKILDLSGLYSEIVQDSDNNKDLVQHFEHIAQRLQQYPDLDCSTLESLQDSWLSNYQTADHPETWINALFLFKKAKPYWQQVYSEHIHDHKAFQAMLCDVIAEFYRDRFRNKDEVKGEVPADHIPCLFRTIYRIVYEGS